MATDLNGWHRFDSEGDGTDRPVYPRSAGIGVLPFERAIHACWDWLDGPECPRTRPRTSHTFASTWRPQSLSGASRRSDPLLCGREPERNRVGRIIPRARISIVRSSVIL